MGAKPNQLKPLKSRLSDEELRQRAARTDVRAALSREHAMTRGIAQGAYNNTIYLRRVFKRAAISGLIGGGLVLAAQAYQLFIR